MKELAADVEMARSQQERFNIQLAELNQVTARVKIVQDVFYGGLDKELSKNKVAIAQVRKLATDVELRLNDVYRDVNDAEVYVMMTEEASTRACRAADATKVATTKEKAREYLDEVVRHVAAAEESSEKANPGLFVARHVASALSEYLKQCEAENYRNLATLRGLHWDLARIDSALATWDQCHQLEMNWMDLFGGLRSLVNDHRQLQNKALRTAEYIQAILAPHNPNESILAILQQVEGNLQTLGVIREAIIESWDKQWEWRSFPMVDLPATDQLLEARQLCEEIRNLLKPTGDQLDAIDIRITRLKYVIEKTTQRVVAAKAFAELYLLLAIYDFDRVWLNGDNVAQILGRPDTSGGRDATLPPADGELTLNPRDTEFPRGEDELTQNRGAPVMQPEGRIDREPVEPRPRTPPAGRSAVLETDPPADTSNYDGTYTIFQDVGGTGRQPLAQPFEAMTWTTEGSDRASLSLVVTSQIPNQALQLAGISRNVKVTAVRKVDPLGNEYFTADGPELTRLVRGVATLSALIAAGADSAFGPADAIVRNAPQIAVTVANLTLTPSGEDSLKIVVHSDITIRVAGVEKRFKKDEAGIAKRRDASSTPR